MKYLVLLCDGMADIPNKDLKGKTPMEIANKVNFDKLSQKSEMGMVKTVADGMQPGSDIANLSVLGYNPKKYYTGRSPLEAVSIGIDMKDADIAFRCNLVTLTETENYRDKSILDYCADDISTEESKILIEHLESNLGNKEFHFYSGVSYRHCLIWDKGNLDIGALTPPHDITGQKITNYLNVNKNGEKLLNLMEKSYELLNTHPINKERRKKGKGVANSIWIWGEGTKSSLPSFEEKYGLKGAIISAVDLLKGIGILAGMKIINVPNATGYIDTNFNGKAQAAIDALNNGIDFVYLHIEAPDECGHRGEVDNKVKSIELIDKLILEPILEEFSNTPIKILICPDHPTPLAFKTHTADPVPYLIYDSTNIYHSNAKIFSENEAAETGNLFPIGYELMSHFLI